MIGVYVPGQSFLHRLAPGWKLLGLVVAAIVLAIDSTITLPAFVAAALIAAWIDSDMDARALGRLIRPVLWILVPVALFQTFFAGGEAAIRVILVMIDLVIAAGLVSVTTRMTDLLDSLTSLLQPLAWIAISPAVVAFAVSFVIRLVPAIAQIARELDEARRARGASRNPFAMAGPLLIRVIGMGNAMGEALDARGFGDNMR